MRTTEGVRGERERESASNIEVQGRREAEKGERWQKDRDLEGAGGRRG